VHDSLSALQLETGWIDLARQKAAVFIETLSPSKFSPEEEIAPAESADAWIEIEPELRPPRIENPATRYGLWWHDFIQQVNWIDESSWDKVFAANIVSSPDPARSKREWEMLKKHLASDADFRRRINATIVHPEMPFFWRLNESRSLEGIVDLALFDSNADRCLILDWKTNRVARDKRIDPPPDGFAGANNLRELYRPQIAAYWKAVTEMTGITVDAGIYSTSTGQFIEYDSDGLAIEWQRLRNLPRPELAAKLAVI
jgi:hypothetical protein